MRKAVFATVVLLAADVVMSATSLEDCTAYLLRSDSGTIHSFTNGVNWSDGRAPGPGSTNYVGSGLTMWSTLSSTNRMVYAGDVLVLAGDFVSIAGGLNREIEWPELRMENGSSYRWSSFGSIFGKIKIESDSEAPATIKMFYPANINSLMLYSAFYGDGAAVMKLARTDGSPTVSLPDLAYNVPGTFSSFYGTCIVATNAEIQPSNSAKPLPGSFIVEAGGYWSALSYYNQEMYVGSLDLRDGSHFWSSCTANGLSSLTVVTNELKLGAVKFQFVNVWKYNEKTYSTLPTYTLGGNPVKVALFKLVGAAAEKVPALTSAILPDYPENQKLAGIFPHDKKLVCETNGDGSKTIYAMYYDNESGNVYVNNAGGACFASASATNWVPEGVPTSDAAGIAYMTKTITLEAWNNYNFTNLTFYFAPSAGINMQCGTFSAERVVFCGGSGVISWIGSDVKTLACPITIYASNTVLQLGPFAKRELHVRGDIDGAGTVQVSTQSPHINPINYVYFHGSHGNLHGGFMVYSTPNIGPDADTSLKDGYPKQIWPDISLGNYTTVSINRGDQFGGEYRGADAWRSIWFNCYAKIDITNDVTVSEVSRGVFVDFPGAQFNVSGGSTFKLHVPITYGGELIKMGAGTLELGGSARFIDGRESTAPQEGTNVLTVSAGSLKVSSTNACDGVQVSFAEGTQLVLDYANEDTRAVGLYNLKWGTPFTVGTADGKLPVEIENLPVEGHRDFACALCTVTTAAEASMGLSSSSFKISRPRGYIMAVVRTENGGKVTYAASFTPSAMLLIVR